MMSEIVKSPIYAWNLYLKDKAKSKAWLENSRDISKQLKLSNRELFGLILLAHMHNHQLNSKDWRVGYDCNDVEPNDGFITNSEIKINIEHKFIPQMAKENALDEIISIYKKHADKGEGYGKNRVLLIHTNQASLPIKISALRDHISGESPFEKVLLVSCATMSSDNKVAIMHITEHYPQLNAGIISISFNVITGRAKVSP